VAGSKRVLVFDVGGGTTDVTLMAVDEGRFDVVSAAGNNALGGEDLDSALGALVSVKCRASVAAKRGLGAVVSDAAPGVDAAAAAAAADDADGADTAAEDEALLRDPAFREAVAGAREALSHAETATVAWTFAPKGDAGGATTPSLGPKSKAAAPVVAQVSVTRGEFERCAAPFVARARSLVVGVLEAAARAHNAAAAAGRDSGAGVGDGGSGDAVGGGSGGRAAVAEQQWDEVVVDEVVLVGGCSRTPCLRAMLRTLFPLLPDLCTSSDAMTSVAEGLAIRGASSSTRTMGVVRRQVKRQ